MTLGFFPTPYPDELLYSVFARYGNRAQYPSRVAINYDLFGAAYASLSIALPGHLDYLVNNLPAGHSITSQRLIDQHTLFPYYAPFLPAERADLIVRHMRGSTPSAAYRFAGITTGSIIPPKHLRYCPSCVLEDKQQFGESYWHRTHQVPGVEVCSEHSLFLQNSVVERIMAYAQPLPAEQVVIKDSPARKVNFQLADHRVLTDIVKDAGWLLKQRNLTVGFECLRAAYISVLAEKGFAVSGRVRLQKLSEAFFSYYSQDLLNLLQCNKNKLNQRDWLFSLFNGLKNNKAISPLRHLLVVQFLGYTFEALFTLATQSALISIHLGSHKRHKDSNVRTNEGCLYSEENPRKINEERLNKIMAYRNEWRIILRNYPNANRSFLISYCRRVSTFLKRHDNEWLQNNLPPPRRKKPVPVRTVDWVKRDARLAQEVRDAALRLRSTSGRPVRITRLGILKEIGVPGHNRKKYLAKLPLTIEALSKVVESRTDYAIRRIYWAADCLRVGETIPTRSLLMTRAMVWPIKHIEEVRVAVENAFSMLQLSHGPMNFKAA